MSDYTCGRAHKGRRAYYAGLAAEQSVARVYRDRGYALAAERWRGRGGEIDLIMERDGLLVFVEVKKSGSFDNAADRIVASQKTRIFSAAQEFAGGRPKGLLTDMRFDAALVDAAGAVRIIENALTDG